MDNSACCVNVASFWFIAEFDKGELSDEAMTDHPEFEAACLQWFVHCVALVSMIRIQGDPTNFSILNR